MLKTVLKKIFGSKQEKDIKRLQPYVDEINAYFDEYESLSDEELRAKTDEFKAFLKERTEDLDEEKEKLEKTLREEALDPKSTLDLKDRIKAADKEIHEVVEEASGEILTQAFAVVKQACKRLKDNMHRFEYAGNKDVWDMIPYDVQLMGAVVLHEGKIAEMATGEGKTLVAVMPLYLNALAGKGVHLVTVNDYLAKRDAEWMGPVYEFLGVSVGSIQSNMDHEDRKRMYNKDITYGTNNEFGFDYLRDNMVVDAEQMVQREHWYVIVDEIDSVLIDEARTPLIISGPVGQSDQKFDEMNPRVRKLVGVQNKLVTEYVAKAERLLKTEKKEDREEAGAYLLRANRGLPKHKRFRKLIQAPEIKKLLQETELFFLRDQGKRMHELDEDLYYTVDEKNHNIDIMDKGRELLATAQEDAEMFVIPDIASEMSVIEGDENMSAGEKQRRKDELNRLYAERSDRIHTVTQLLRAYSLYEKDIEYVIQEGQVKIVDEHTGRILEGRRYSEGLHQAIEAKEKVKVERDTQTLATITLQNYFRQYNKLAGMTGTAETEAMEFSKIYELDVVVVPTNVPIIRDDREDLIFKTQREKYSAIIEEIDQILKEGRAVLVGTASVEVSELISKMLTRKKVNHNVLNAKHHSREADIIKEAGKKRSVTIATNMAGRGTDIKLDHEVRKNGGLAIVGSERHDARRIDLQLRGRAGRQGDPGSSQFFISLEDKLMRLFGGERIANVMNRLKIPEGEPIQHKMISRSVENAQKKVEENNFSIRKRLLEYDDVMNQQREVIYARRKYALYGERLKGELFEYIEDLAYDWFETFAPEKEVEGYKDAVRTTLLCEVDIDEKDLESSNQEQCLEKTINAANDYYERKEKALGGEFMGRLERIAILQTIDEKWRDHLRVMDDIKEGIHLRSYGQKDPLIEYKKEAYENFIDLIKEINADSVNFAFKYFPKVVERKVRVREKAPAEAEAGEDGLPELKKTFVEDDGSMQFQHPSEAPAFIQQPQGAEAQEAQAQGAEGQPKVQTIKRKVPKVGRNDPCPCGSGKKYKHCCGRKG